MKNLSLALFAAAAVAFAGLWLSGRSQIEKLQEAANAGRAKMEEQTAQLDSQRQTIELMHQQQQDLQAGIGRLYNQLQAARTNSAAESNVATGRGAGAQSAPGGSGASSGLGTLVTQLMENPDTKKMIEQQQRMAMEMMYRPLFKELDLTAAQTEQFLSLLSERSTRGMNNVSALLGKDPAQRRAAIDVMADVQKELDLSLRNLLGDERFSKYSEFNETMAERTALTQFSSLNPVTDDQTKQLLQVIREEKKRATAETAPLSTVDRQLRELDAMASEEGMDRLLQQQQTVNSRVLDRAKTILTPEQLATYGTFQTNQFELQKTGMKMARVMFAPATNGGAEPMVPVR